ncbi:hypothetical protein KAFR_0G02950 [Kazachstania africana CBS 2517]|uniref:Regulator of rDNA transcription protein 5 n=1 Tax=Kazachstania africana (strain ATCC 22294 / BCRC 22015 / CBS 2517 / CECT 1963 / NBRC 1671 / NRRL Y-8276) TaxID=1071382 RepID=H2AY77_KAZAF|nr:hypothetical protein KAFR_0G02950 [Kazachstania africana CBS 2517]CCF59327.1 hypothetical protein KAFR_0G02950 [Kazachstania africana CBS 2517]
MSATDSTNDVTTKRVYISNLNFNTGEKELQDYLVDFKPRTVYIPCNPHKDFRRKYFNRPMGIAYAEFESVEEAKAAIDGLNEKDFKGRPLKLKPYIPYTPHPKGRSSSNVASSETLIANNQEAAIEPSVAANTEPVEQKRTRYGRLRGMSGDISKDTVYCKYLPVGVDDSHLRALFSAYSPREIWIFKSTPQRKICVPVSREPFTAALITLDTEVELKEICKLMSKGKLLGKKVSIKPAFIKKIEEVKQVALEDQPNLVVQEDVVIEQASREQPAENEQTTANAHLVTNETITMQEEVLVAI